MSQKMAKDVVEYFFNNWIWMPPVGHQKTPVKVCPKTGAG